MINTIEKEDSNFTITNGDNNLMFYEKAQNELSVYDEPYTQRNQIISYEEKIEAIKKNNNKFIISSLDYSVYPQLLYVYRSAFGHNHDNDGWGEFIESTTPDQTNGKKFSLEDTLSTQPIPPHVAMINSTQYILNAMYGENNIAGNNMTHSYGIFIETDKEEKFLVGATSIHESDLNKALKYLTERIISNTESNLRAKLQDQIIIDTKNKLYTIFPELPNNTSVYAWHELFRLKSAGMSYKQILELCQHSLAELDPDKIILLYTREESELHKLSNALDMEEIKRYEGYDNEQYVIFATSINHLREMLKGNSMTAALRMARNLKTKRKQRINN